jgi:hypothetical protein
MEPESRYLPHFGFKFINLKSEKFLQISGLVSKFRDEHGARKWYGKF